MKLMVFNLDDGNKKGWRSSWYWLLSLWLLLLLFLANICYSIDMQVTYEDMVNADSCLRVVANNWSITVLFIRCHQMMLDMELWSRLLSSMLRWKFQWSNNWTMNLWWRNAEESVQQWNLLKIEIQGDLEARSSSANPFRGPPRKGQVTKLTGIEIEYWKTK